MSGSGKSTWANMFAQANPSYKIVSRDKIREMLFGYSESNISEYYKLSNIKENEVLVTRTQTTLMRQILAQGYDLLIDNTHLELKYIKEIHDEFFSHTISHKVFGYNPDTQEIEEGLLDKLYIIDATRSKPVGRKVLDKQFVQFKKLVKDYDLILELEEISDDIDSYMISITRDSYNPKAIICDLDGTIANKDHREAYGFNSKEIRNDKPTIPVVNLVNNFYDKGYQIIFLSGRNQEYFGETYNWLITNTSIKPQDLILHMRKNGDFRKDNVVKREIYEEHIQEDYNVEFAIDDRPTITNLWYNLEIFTFNVNQSLKEF